MDSVLHFMVLLGIGSGVPVNKKKRLLQADPIQMEQSFDDDDERKILAITWRWGLQSRCKLEVCERFYFTKQLPNLPMHFEIIENIDMHLSLDNARKRPLSVTHLMYDNY